MKPHHYTLIAAFILATEGAFSIVRLLTRMEYPTIAPVAGAVVDIGLASLWVTGAVAALVHRTLFAFFVVMAGAFMSLVHAAMFSIVSPSTGAGVPFLVGALAVAFCLKRSVKGWDIEAPATYEDRITPEPNAWSEAYRPHA
ncbi:MAG: hypothetical protein U0174_08635 [Polyangiaceae bacterium]